MDANGHATAALVLHFRSVESTAACLESLQAQAIERLLLVDNSEDEGRSLKRLQPMLAQLRARGMAVELLEPGSNLGFAAGVNRGLEAIRARFGAVRVLLINNDAELAPGALARLHADLDQGADIVSPLLQSPDGELKSVMYYHRWTGLLLKRGFPGAFPHLSGCCLLLSVPMAQADLLNERFFFYGEDAYLGWRLRRDGAVGRVVPAARALHLGSQGSRRGSLFYEYHMARAHLELAAELAAGRLDHCFLIAGRCVSLPARALLRAFRQRSLSPVRGLAMAVSDAWTGTVRRMTPRADA